MLRTRQNGVVMNAGKGTEVGRKREIDILKGLLTVSMILCHSIQFFGVEKDSVQRTFMNLINLVAFPGFVFCFGYAGYIAYFRNNRMESTKKMLINALRILVAFYISGIAYVALVEGKIFRIDFIKEVLFLQKYPGWSEFLASFVALLVVGIISFPVYRNINGKILTFVALVSGMACFFPYDLVQNSWLALLVGSRHYITFPVVQYSIFFAAGAWFGKKEIRWQWQILVLCICMGIPCMYCYIMTGSPPERFPVSIWYLCGGFLFVYLYYLLSCYLERVRNKVLKQVAIYLEHVGADSLYYLLFSNLLIFALDCSKFSFRSVGYAYIYFIVILLVIKYFNSLLSGRRYTNR